MTTYPKALHVATAQISYDGPGRCDITIKGVDQSGKPCPLAPNDWNMVMGVKEGRISQEAYEKWYKGLVYKRWQENPKQFDQYLFMGICVLCCYCAAGQPCHRHYALDALRWMCNQNGIELVYLGEVKELKFG